MLHNRIFLLCLLTVALIPGLSEADLLEKGFTATYTVDRNDIPLGITKRKLVSHEDGHMEFTSFTYATGFVKLFFPVEITERSMITYRNDVIKPHAYFYEEVNKHKKNKKQYVLEFNWGKGLLNNTYQQQQLKLQKNTQDLLSFQLAMMHNLQQGMQKSNYLIADKKKLKIYTTKKIGEDNLETPAGRYEVLILEYYNEEKNDRFTFWCAKSLDYLPVRIKRTEHDGDEITMVLDSFSH